MGHKCKICKKEIIGNSKKRYCSRECYLAWNRTRNEVYRKTSIGKEKLRYGRLKYDRANKIKVYVRRLTRHSQKKDNICLICGENKTTEWNHISYQPNIYFEVCKKCHEIIHHNKSFKIRFYREDVA